MNTDKPETKQTELQRLFMRVLPPEQFGEDANVEELYNRLCGLEKINEELIEALINAKEKMIWECVDQSKYKFIDDLLKRSAEQE